MAKSKQIKRKAVPLQKPRRVEQAPVWYRLLLVVTATLIVAGLAFVFVAQVSLDVADRCIKCVVTGNYHCGLSRHSLPPPAPR